MKKQIIFILFFTISLNILAQRNSERIEALKIAVITKNLNLSQIESLKFWPIYDTYLESTTKIKREDIRLILRTVKDKNNPLDNIKTRLLLDKLIDAENSLFNLRIQLITELREVISDEKIILLILAEEDFKRKLFELYKKI